MLAQQRHGERREVVRHARDDPEGLRCARLGGGQLDIEHPPGIGRSKELLVDQAPRREHTDEQPVGRAAGLHRAVERRLDRPALAHEAPQHRADLGLLVPPFRVGREQPGCAQLRVHPQPPLRRHASERAPAHELVDELGGARGVELGGRAQVRPGRGRDGLLGVKAQVCVVAQVRAPQLQRVATEHADRVGLRGRYTQNLGVEQARDDLRAMTDLPVLSRWRDHHAWVLAQELAQLLRAELDALGARDLGDLRCLAADDRLRVGAQTNPQLFEAIVAHEARVIDGLVQGVEADDAPELVTLDEIVLVALDPHPLREQLKARLASARVAADRAVEIALVEGLDLAVAKQARHALARPPKHGLPVEHDRNRRSEAARLDGGELEAPIFIPAPPGLGRDLAPVELAGAHVGAVERALGPPDLHGLGAPSHDHARGPALAAIARLDHDVLRLEQEQGVDAEGERADVSEVDALF